LAEVGSSEVRPFEVCSGQIGPGNVNATEISPNQAGSAEASPNKVGAYEFRLVQIFAPKISVAKIAPDTLFCAQKLVDGTVDVG